MKRNKAHRGTNLLPRTPADDPSFLAVCLDGGGLLYHDAESGEAWIACQDPIDARDVQ